MARTNVAYTPLVANGTLADPAGTALNAGVGNGHAIVAAQPERTVLRITNTTAGAVNATIKAGVYPPALASGLGDLTVPIGANSAAFVGPFESGRFIQKDGSLNVDIAAGHTGTITAFLEPKAK